MLLVKTKVLPSPIHELGLFADQFISKGTVMWEFEPGFDLSIPPEVIEKLPEVPRAWFKHYSHLSSKTGNYTLSFDNDRYINHSDDPNTEDVETGRAELATVASRDIQEGEEITCNYMAFSKESAMTEEFM